VAPFFEEHDLKLMRGSIDELQADLDLWILEYNEQRPHHGRWCSAKPPDADLPGCNADDEGENDRGLTATDTKT
jgi:hypothetical protein